MTNADALPTIYMCIQYMYWTYDRYYKILHILTVIKQQIHREIAVNLIKNYILIHVLDLWFVEEIFYWLCPEFVFKLFVSKYIMV